MSHKPKLYRRLFANVKAYWPAFLVAAIGNVLYATVDSYSTYLFKPILDKGFIAKDFTFLKLLPFIVIGLFLVRGLGGFASTYAMGWIGRKVVYYYRMALFEKYLQLPAKYYDRSTTGELLAKLTYHVEQVTEATSNALTTLVQQGCFVIGLLIVMFITSWRFTCFIFVVLPILVVLIQFVSKRFRRLSKRIQDSMGDINHIAEETLSGYKEIRLFCAQKQQAERFERVIHYNFVQEMKMIFTNALNTPIIQLIGALVLASIIYAAFHSNMAMISAGSFVTLIAAMLAILKPAKNLSGINSTIQRALAAAEDIYAMLDSEVEHDPGQNVLAKPASGKIDFVNVNFGYQPGRAVLKAINLQITPGEMVAFVGPSGAGKSSLISLLSGFYQPDSGEIRLDNIPIQSLTLSSLRSQMAMVSQHVILFDDTIYRNIAFGARSEAAEAEVVTALKMAHAWNFVSNLPEGIHTRIGENGLNLSGGQRQRIAIARAILAKAPILILDEATSALDNESEKAIQAALRNLSGKCTRIIIAHRLSTIIDADRIVVLEQGQIVEEGDHQSLMAKKGLYANLQRHALLT